MLRRQEVRRINQEDNNLESNDFVNGDWIMKHTGRGKTIQDVYRLIDKIEIEVAKGEKFPEVELLPSIEINEKG
jgi:hypothetical protein